MSAHQALMVSIITEGTNLGSESASSSDESVTKADASAAINFNTNGTVTFSQTGGSRSNTAPATNWNTNGGSYFSYELISIDSSFDGGSAGVFQGVTSLDGSTIHGENRYSLSTTAISISTSASGMLGELSGGFGDISIKVSIWDSASGGSRKAYGTYGCSSSATVY